MQNIVTITLTTASWFSCASILIAIVVPCGLYFLSVRSTAITLYLEESGGIPARNVTIVGPNAQRCLPVSGQVEIKKKWVGKTLYFVGSDDNVRFHEAVVPKPNEGRVIMELPTRK